MFYFPDYSEDEKRAVYTEMARQACLAIRKQPVVLDGTFHRNEWRNNARQITSLPPVYIHVTATDDLIRERLHHPRRESDADYNVYKHLKRQFDPPPARALRINSTNSNVDQMVQIAMEYINQSP